MTTGAAAEDCAKGFFKSNVVGTPPASGSSYVCTTKEITCLPSTGASVVVVMKDQKAIGVSGSKAKFTYACQYSPNIP
jgi:hypothetical protein